MVFKYLQEHVRKVAESPKLIFLDKNALIPPVPEDLPRYSHPQGSMDFFDPKNPPNHILDYLNSLIKQKIYDPQLNGLIRNYSREYLGFLFNEIKERENIYLSQTTINEVKEHHRTFLGGLGSRMFPISILGCLKVKQNILENLLTGIESLPGEKKVDFNIKDKHLGYFKKKFNVRAGLSDINLFMDACLLGLNKEKPLEIWSRDKHFVSLAGKYRELRRNKTYLPGVSIRRPCLPYFAQNRSSDECMPMVFSSEELQLV